ncbi:MAG: hypothetical protein COA49_07000 [Bacteroidetes bacterium]|nr:MAG: hypothetical protein COA49_07000 [Bacteroidota bacterium]
MKKNRRFSQLLLVTFSVSLIFTFFFVEKIDGFRTINNDSRKNAFSKFEPWEAASFKWSYPDNDWDARSADEALVAVREHFEALEALDYSREIGGSWRMEGPQNIGGRLNAIQRDPFDANHILVGSAAGGLFGTNDGGESWVPLTDDFGWMAMGSIAFHPSQEGVIYIGTGDPQISSHPRIGNGVYRSTDGGANWVHLGLDSARIVSKVLILEDSPEIVMAATMGNPAVKGPDRGLYRSTNSGATWTQVLLPSDSAGVNDIAYDPTSGIMIAAGWNRLRNSISSLVTGPESKLYRSSDLGLTWTPITNPWGMEDRCRIGVNEVNGTFFALVVGLDMQVDNIYKSTNGGLSWTPIIVDPAPLANALGGFGWYFSKIRVNPWNVDDITILGVDIWNSLDGGETWSEMAPPWWEYSVHADKHDMQWVGPNSALLATDGGAYRTSDHGATWTDIENIPNSQFYRVEVNPHNLGRYTGGAQDNGTSTGSYIGLNSWNRDRGGDGFTPVFHPTNPNFRIATVQYANFAYSYDPPTSINPVWTGMAYTDYNDRKAWDAPIMLHPANPDHIWTGTQRMWRMIGEPSGNWTAMSSDLTLNVEPALSYRIITSITGSPIDENIVAAGTSDGQVHFTTDGGATWNLMTSGLPNRYVTDLYFDPYNPDSLFCTVSGYRDYAYTPHILKAALGGPWHSISGDLPEHPMNSVVALSEVVWAAASDAGVYATVDAGNHWERLGAMPWIPVYDLVVDTAQGRLVAGTFSRSIQSFPIDSILVGTPPITTYTCPEDIVVNGIIDISDVLLILSQYGCIIDCQGDIDGDNIVTISDVLQILSMFGQNCP